MHKLNTKLFNPQQQQQETLRRNPRNSWCKPHHTPFQDAKEAVQETFITVWQKWQTFEGRSKFSSWIYRVAANEAYMKMRKKKKLSSTFSIEQMQEPLNVIYIINQ